MIIRKNTKAFKTIQHIVSVCKDRPDRDRLIRLYITKGGHSIDDRIAIEAIQNESAFFYDMNYQAVLDNLGSSDRQLNMSDDIPGIYFFHSSSNKIWDETPFEFDKAIAHEFGNLPELPVVRKKEKVEKISIAAVPGTKPLATGSKTKSTTKKPVVREVHKEIKQPRYTLRHPIQFSALDEVVFRQAGILKRDVLDFYAHIADAILPHIKDRLLPDLARHYKLKPAQMPAWVRYGDNDGMQTPLCNDKEHLLLFVEKGCIEFRVCNSKLKSVEFPDYAIIALDYSESDLSAAIEVARGIWQVLIGLKLPSLVKTDPPSGMHIYIPLDAKSDFRITRNMAQCICKLIKLKFRDTVVLREVDKHDYGKISLNYDLNGRDQSVIAPYSFVAEAPGSVAMPLLWEEIVAEFNPEMFTPETTIKRIKRSGDIFAAISKNKVNAGEVLKRLEENYSFLF